MNWLNFRHLYSFWMVARTGSFTGAAEEMHVAQSAVSSQVAALETYLDQPLFVRTHRSIELTAVGQQLLGYAHVIFAQSRAINAIFRDRDGLMSAQTLRVGVVGGASRNFVYRLLADYLSAAPDVHLSVSTGSYPELYDLLKRFELDSIVSLELPKRKDLGEVTYQKLGESEMCVVATPELLAEVRRNGVGGPVDVFQFRHPFEVDLMGKHVQPLLDCELERRMHTDDIPLLRFFANSGKGIAVLPRVGVFEDLEAGVVEAIELPLCPPAIIYGITMVQAHSARGMDHEALRLWSSDS